MEHKYTNQLVHETSPYLLQHAHNPVDWYPWGEKALKKAKEENKPLLISIGYAACHWCHVMEHESFENEEVAQIMNKHFVCIKVDREERPDIDNIYMSAVQLIAGNGGWPLNCFALPDGAPFYGGTYFPLMQWKNMLLGINKAYQENYDKVVETAIGVKNGVKNHEIVVSPVKQLDFDLERLKMGYKSWKSFFDLENGGNKGAPKFPMSVNYSFILDYYLNTKDKSAITHVVNSLEKMANGGIYDQIGGGFARYAVDDIWKVPHFEKMLYDNAQLISLYAQVFKLTSKSQFLKVVEETTEFTIREMQDFEGGFYSSYDADSEGVEGKFYCWEKTEIEEALGEDAALYCDYFGITDNGNWENMNILHVSESLQHLADKYKLDEKEVKERIEKSNKILYKIRDKRIKPGLDDKILTSWNALMVNALVDAYLVTHNKAYLDGAISTLHFIEKNVLIDKQLYRNYKKSKATIPAFLDDYANLIQALLKVYQVIFDEKWLYLAKELTEKVISDFYDEKSGMFFYTSVNQRDVIVRKMELNDNVIPSSNSTMALNLFNLSKIFYLVQYERMAKQMLTNNYQSLSEKPFYYSQWGILLFKFLNPPYEVAITGKNAMQNRLEFEKHNFRNLVFVGSTKQSEIPILKDRFVGEDKIYVCQNKVCKLPVDSVEKAVELL